MSGRAGADADAVGGLPHADAAAVAQLIDTDPHVSGSVDALLLERQQWLTAATVAQLYSPPPPPARPAEGSRPALEGIVRDCLAGTVHDFERAVALRRWVAAIPRRYPVGGRSTADGYWGDFAALPCGGTEEAVIERGSPLAAELSRVLVTQLRLAGLPARLVFLYDVTAAARHCVTEVYCGGRWSVLDPVSDRTFVWAKHGFASAWEIRQMPALVDGLQDSGPLRYVASSYYRVAAVAEYDPAAPDWRYDEQIVDAATAERLRLGAAS